MKVRSILVAGTAFIIVAVAIIPTKAFSQDFSIQIGRSDGYGSRVDERYGRGCSPREAIRQARARGMKDPQIDSIDGRRVVVDGYGRRNEYTKLFLANRPGCPRIR